MAFCSHCGAKLEENAKFCSVCGTGIEATSETALESKEQETEAPVSEKASGNMNMPMLVWAIINLVACCTPLGIAGLLFTIFAKDAPSAAEEAKKLKTAKTCNIIGTVGGAIVIILYAVFVGLITALEYM